MQWFKHDTDATMDFKIKKLLIKYGAIGYAIYFHCLELIAGSVSEKNITFELEHDAEIIADDLRISGTSEKSGKDLVEEIMRYMIELNLFEESNGHIFCFKLLNRMDSSMTSSPRFRELINKAKETNREEKCECHDNVMISHDDVMINHDNVMQEKKRIEKNRIEKITKEEKEKKDTDKESACAFSEISTSQNQSKDYSSLQKDMYSLIIQHNLSVPNSKKVPVSGSEISFIQKESRELFTAIGTNEPCDRIRQALINYLKVAKSDTWRTSFTWSSFCKNFNEFVPEYFSLDKYVKHEKTYGYTVHTDEEYAVGCDDPETLSF